jgi:hypothetical protein
MYGETIKAVEAAREILKAQGYFVDNLWHVDDVHFLCEEKNHQPVSDTEAMEIFAIANQSFDGEFGLNWKQLEKALDYYVKKKKSLSLFT